MFRLLRFAGHFGGIFFASLASIQPQGLRLPVAGSASMESTGSESCCDGLGLRLKGSFWSQPEIKRRLTTNRNITVTYGFGS